MSPEIEVTVKTREAATVAYVGMKGPYDQMGQAMGRLMGGLGQKGLAPVGPPSASYFNNPMEVAPEELLWEVRVAVAPGSAEAEPGAEGLGVKRLDAVEVASTMHKGPLDQVGNTYMALGQWVAKNGYEVVGPAEEVYLSDPRVTAPDDLLTEVRLPVGKR